MNDKHPGGRPTIYNNDILVKAREYLSLCQDQDNTIEESLEPQAHGGSLKRERKIKVKLPTKGGLAVYLGVSRVTLDNWAKEYPEFFYIMEKLGSEQEDRLINKGLSGDYNPTISKLLLSKHGYRESTDITSDGEKIAYPIMELPREKE